MYSSSSPTNIVFKFNVLYQNVLWDLPGCNPYKAVSFDPLHAYHSGLFGHHLWGQFKIRIDEVPGRKASVTFDKQYEQIS